MADRHHGDPYSVLGVLPGATDEAIATAYRALARRHHPDIAGDGGTRQMMDINAAFELIRTAKRRADYALEHRTGGAGPPPGRPSGSVLDFGRHVGWSLGEIARLDPGYLVWLAERPDGMPYREEIDTLLRLQGIRRPTAKDETVAPWRRGYGYR